jgi:hypothetical protein
MKLTKHAQDRLQQRGISLSVTELIYRYGEPIQRPGGVFAYHLPKRKASQLLHDLKQTIHRIESAQKKVILVDDSTGSVITAYNNSN